MAYRLGEYVIYGELRNTKRYSTHGIIVLRGEEPGRETILHLNLTGDCDRDLRGKTFRFSPGEEFKGDAVFRPEEHKALQRQQIGPTGTMTAQGWVRALPCSAEEFVRLSYEGRPPETPWRRRIYLEWYSQNGRVVVEMADVIVEERIRDAKGEDDEGEWVELPNLALPPGMDGRTPAAGPEFTEVHLDGDEAHIEHWMPRAVEDDEEEEGQTLDRDLQRQLDAEAAAIDRAIGDESESESEDVREAELIDYCMDHAEQVPVQSLLPGGEELAPPEDLSDEQLEVAFKSVLGRMAMIGVAFDVCEHYSLRDCYRLLRDEILPNPHAYEELVGSGWVTHVGTHDHCERCEAEALADYEREKGRRFGD